MVNDKPTIIGRSSSHFTRVTRIFAAELEVPYSFEVVADLAALDAAVYGGNPALRVPALVTPRGLWVGSLNICRELARLSGSARRPPWPEDLAEPVLANAQELTLHAMAVEVSLITAQLGGVDASSPYVRKLQESLRGSLAWLEAHAAAALAGLPAARASSFLEVTLFCLLTHLEFRGVLSTAPYSALRAFCVEYSRRPAAEQTAYRFD